MYFVRTRDTGAAAAAPIRQLARTTLPDIPIYQNGIATLEQLSRIARREMLQVGVAAAGGEASRCCSPRSVSTASSASRCGSGISEIGIRVALGARPEQVIGMFFVSGLRLGAIGLVLGLPLSVVAMFAVASGPRGGADCRGGSPRCCCRAAERSRSW